MVARRLPRPVKKAAKTVVKAAKAKKPAMKTAKKSSKKSANKTKSSAGRKAVGKKAPKKVAKKKEGETIRMDDTNVQIHFDAPAVLRKWPSLNKERIKQSWGATPYLVAEGTLDECIREFMSKPASQHHLYEIHTAPQGDLVSAVLSAEHTVELARLRDFL